MFYPFLTDSFPGSIEFRCRFLSIFGGWARNAFLAGKTHIGFDYPLHGQNRLILAWS